MAINTKSNYNQTNKNNKKYKIPTKTLKNTKSNLKYSSKEINNKKMSVTEITGSLDSYLSKSNGKLIVIDFYATW